MPFRDGDIVILIGAGCSVDAGLPTSAQMIEKVEGLLENEWKNYKGLYNLIKSSALYADGIRGRYDLDFDIERLVSILGELEKKESSILYPFIGSWKPRLLEIAGHDFEILSKFKQEILKKLVKWVKPQSYDNAKYYENFFRLQNELDFPLRIFTLNYDLCLEKSIPEGEYLERGFDKGTHLWDWRRFERMDEDAPNIYLYKMHGSIDWERDENEGNILREVDYDPDNPDLIFGTNYKLQYIDPYLFYAYELRKYSLESKLIITIGYSFRDEHINGILIQALSQEPERSILIVSPDANSIHQKLTEEFPRIKEQLFIEESKAKDFLQNVNILDLEEKISLQKGG